MGQRDRTVIRIRDHGEVFAVESQRVLPVLESELDRKVREVAIDKIERRFKAALQGVLVESLLQFGDFGFEGID